MRDGTERRRDGGRERVTRGDLFADRSVLTPSYVPERLPERAAHRRSIGSALAGTESGTVAVVGRPGQGKTTTVGRVLDDREGHTVTVSCADGASVQRLAIELHNELVPPGRRLGHSEARARTAAADALRASEATVALDDVDAIDAAALESFVTDVVDGRAPLVVVADSLQFRNALSRSFRTDVIDDVVVFGPYERDQLRGIVERRTVTAFRPDVVESRAVDQIASFAADDGGDAGVAIELLRHAGDVAVERGDAAVRTAHVERASERYRTRRDEETVAALSVHERATLAGLRALAGQDATPSSFDAVIAAYRDVLADGQTTPNGRRSVRNYLERLREAGLVERHERAGRYEFSLSVAPSRLDALDGERWL